VWCSCVGLLLKMWSCFFHKKCLSINCPAYAAFVGAQGRCGFGQNSGRDWHAAFGGGFGGVAVAAVGEFHSDLILNWSVGVVPWAKNKGSERASNIIVDTAIINHTGVKMRPCSINLADFLAHTIITISKCLGRKLTDMIGGKLDGRDVAHAISGAGIHCVFLCRVGRSALCLPCS